LTKINLPRIILWAWERPEDLTFLDPQRFGVAFLAQTLTLKDGEVVYSPRHQPLKLPPGVRLIAVTRIESQKITREHVDLTDDLRKELVENIRKTLQLNSVSAVQVDFDAATSERTFYGQLLQDLRSELPDNVALSMTALASFCVGDRWLKDLPVDEAVPMVFRWALIRIESKTYSPVVILAKLYAGAVMELRWTNQSGLRLTGKDEFMCSMQNLGHPLMCGFWRKDLDIENSFLRPLCLTRNLLERSFENQFGFLCASSVFSVALW
jgi:hypothetical protein